MAGESAHRSWRYVIPLLPAGAAKIFYELSGRTTTAPDYSWRGEIEGLGRALPDRTQAHLVGFSGGASLALAFVAAHPGRVASQSLVEPAWSFLPLTPIEADYYTRLDAALRGLASEERGTFRRLLVAPTLDRNPSSNTPTLERRRWFPTIRVDSRM